MADQLFGVLREVVADVEGRPVPAPSTLFTEPARGRLDEADWRTLPRPQAASDDSSAGYLAALTGSGPDQVIAALRAAPDQTVEVKLRLAAAMIEAGDEDGADSLLAEIGGDDPWEWRVTWYQGLAELARDRPEQARASFTAVYETVPGELAPKLALGIACEAAGDAEAGARWYEIVFRTDPSMTSAAFGLARCRLRLGDRDGALTAYEGVPDSSSAYTDAQTARIECLSAAEEGGGSSADNLLRAGAILQSLGIEGERREALSARLFARALELTLSGQIAGDGQDSLLGRPLAERDLRRGLEGSYRALARRAGSRAERIHLVDEANRARPRTWT
jgi:serine/threonine-protein kinase PknG